MEEEIIIDTVDTTTEVTETHQFDMSTSEDTPIEISEETSEDVPLDIEKVD
jgi:hypothetical protein